MSTRLKPDTVDAVMEQLVDEVEHWKQVPTSMSCCGITFDVRCVFLVQEQADLAHVNELLRQRIADLEEQVRSGKVSVACDPNLALTVVIFPPSGTKRPRL